MKIAYLVADFPVLSETFVANEIDKLTQRGADIRVFAFAAPASADLAKMNDASGRLATRTTYISLRDVFCAAALRPLDVLRGVRPSRILHGASTTRSNRILMLLRAVAVAREVRRAGLEHVHAHWPYASQIAHLVRVITGVSFSISIHAHEVAHDNGHFPVIFPELSFAAFCNRGAMEYLLPRIAQKERARAQLIYHGVDLAMFDELPLPADAQMIRLISAGRLTRTKGFDRLIRACAAARAQGLDVRLTILGRGPMEPELRAAATETGFADFLTMPGWVPQQEVRRYMESAHAFALLADTSFHDGLPNVVLEAMASGRPVILSPLPAASEAVSDGVEGFVLKDPADTTGLVEAIRRLQGEPGLLQKLGAAARKRVAADHDANVQIEKMAELLDRCAGT